MWEVRKKIVWLLDLSWKIRCIIMPFLEERGLNYKVYRNYEFNIGHVKFEVLLRCPREDVKLVGL